MSKLMRLMGIALVTAGLTACDVQIKNETPSEYPANHDIGMYEIKASAERGSMVSPASVVLSGVSGDKIIELTEGKDGKTWRGLYSVRCRDSFPLQIRAMWSVQGVSTRVKNEPAEPVQVRLIEPKPPAELKVDTSRASRTGWEGAVAYRFVTRSSTQIQSARIEPVDGDEAAAKAITITTTLPVTASCGEPTEIRLLSKAPKARGNLVIQTDHPAYPEWRTRVEFAPLGSTGS